MVSSQTPLFDWLAEHEGTTSLVFTDVVESTSLLYDAQTTDYRRIIRAHRAQLLKLIQGVGGRLIDETGDQFFAVFARPRDAYDFGTAAVRDPGHERVQIRAGMHHGRVAAEEDRLVGRNVHLGARVMQLAQEGEFWVSDDAKSALELDDSRANSSLDWIRDEWFELKGVPEKQRVWRAR